LVILVDGYLAFDSAVDGNGKLAGYEGDFGSRRGTAEVCRRDRSGAIACVIDQHGGSMGPGNRDPFGTTGVTGLVFITPEGWRLYLP
jgi:hypothetical protein